MMPLFFLSKSLMFPSPQMASKEGLLAVGGDLTVDRLLLAYRLGIFPWYSEGDPILWWSPDPRLVLFPNEFRIPVSLRKTLNKKRFYVTIDQAFNRVIRECAIVRIENQENTWLTNEMIEAYQRLHALGFAHSVEAWHEGQLAGGLYGISLGKIFFGESMFTRVTNASKVAFVKLVNHLKSLSFDMIDCQVRTDHLVRFGAREIPRIEFLDRLKRSLKFPTLRGPWQI